MTTDERKKKGVSGETGPPESLETAPSSGPVAPDRIGHIRREDLTVWEYASLFDMPEPTALELAAMGPDWWKGEGSDLRVGQMGYRTTTTVAGDILVAEIHPAWGRKKRTIARKAKHNLTAERIQKYNEQRARFRLELLMDENFSADDLNMTLTYTDAPTAAEVRKDIRNYIDRLKRERKKRNLPELKYIYAIEDERDGRKKQLHCHLVMSGGINREDAEKIWRKGSEVRGFTNCDRLQPDKEGLRKLAHYIYDQNRGKKDKPKGKRHYSCSKNLKEPRVRSSMSRVGNAKVRRMAKDFNAVAPEIMEKVYPGYEFVRGLRYQENENGTMSESCVRFSDYTDGVYIRVMMKRKKGGGRT